MRMCSDSCYRQTRFFMFTSIRHQSRKIPNVYVVLCCVVLNKQKADVTWTMAFGG